MFKSVLIAEDHESANISVQKTLAELSVARTQYTYYCDDAYTLARKAVENGEPYDLLITDLSFDEDHRPQRLSGGQALIDELKKIQPELKTLVFSAQNKSSLVDSLFKHSQIDGFVSKGRQDAKELKVAIEAIYKGGKHLSPMLRQIVKEKNSHEFSPFDITLISLLSKGILQKDIPLYLQQNGIKPSGLSSVEKRLTKIKEVLDFNKNEQLVAYCKDFGII